MNNLMKKGQMRKCVKHSKGDRAITLIALIVTIIILLILAGVVINLALNNRGLFSRSKIAVRKWNESEANEQQSLQNVIDYIDNMGGEKERINSDVKKALDKAENMGKEEDDTIDPTPGILDGDGTESNPYKIQSIEDLVAFSYNVNSGENTYKDKIVTLQRNLHFDGSYNSYANPNAKYESVSGTSGVIGYKPSGSGSKTIKELVTTDIGFIPIGAAIADGKTFEGNFDGKSHRLVGLYEKNDNYVGVFGYITSPIKISNLVVKDGNIYGKSYSGAIIGYADESALTIENCYNTGAITSSDSFAGGIIGYGYGKSAKITVTNCNNTGTIKGKEQTGGMIGYASLESIIENCYNTGAITSSGSYAGGITGQNSSGSTIESCNNTGVITSSASEAGGIVGCGMVNSAKITVTNCNNTGAITGTGDTGGIIGNGSGSTAISCCNIGDVTGSLTGGIIGNGGIATSCNNTGTIKGESNTGGIIGNQGTATDCYNTGAVIGNGEGGSPTGGIIGVGSIVTNCYNIGDVTSKGLTGGIIGVCYGSGSTVTNCYNTGTITGGSSPTGGIIGQGNTVTNCYNSGAVKGEGYPTGGIMGYGETVSNCYNTGTITGGSSSIGGIMGDGETVTNCYNRGDVTGKNLTGGITGRGRTATNCYNEGTIKGGSSLTGGIIGNGGTASSCYNTGTIIGDSLPTCGIVGYGGKSTNCHNTGDIKMNTPNVNIMYEIGGADNTCTYLLKSTNAQPEKAVGKNEDEMKQIMDMNKFVELMNKKVEENNSDSKNTKLRKWELKDNIPVFSNK